MTLTLMERTRLDKRMSRVQLNQVSGVPVRTIRELESGRVKRPTQDTLEPLADALELSVSALAEDFRRTSEATAAA